MSLTPSDETAICYARAYHSAGISVLPLRSKDKRPAVPWKDMQARPQRLDELDELFHDPEANIGALCGPVSDGLLVLDHDDMKKAQGLQGAPIYQYLLENAPLDKTRRGFHLWVKTPEPIASSKNERFGVDVLAEGKYSVAPPSIVEHKAYGKEQLYLFTDRGKFPPLTLDAEQTNDLSALYGLHRLEIDTNDVPGTTDAPTGRFDVLTGTSTAFYGLGLSIWHRLKNPQPRGKRSEDEAGIVYRCVAIGWTFREVLELFNKHAGAGSKYREKDAQGYGESYLSTLFRSASAEILKKMGPRQRELNDALEALRVSNPFAGRGASTDRAVLRTLIQIQRETNADGISPGMRRIADRAGLELLSVQRSIDRLEKAGHIRRNVVKDATERIDYLVIHLSTSFLATMPGARIQAVAPRLNIEHVAFRAGALGKDGPEVLKFLEEVAPLPFRNQDVPGTLRYVRRILPLLEHAGLIGVVKAEAPKRRGRPDTFYTVKKKILEPTFLDELAEIAGTRGVGARQRAKHEREREAWRARTIGG